MADRAQRLKTSPKTKKKVSSMGAQSPITHRGKVIPSFRWLLFESFWCLEISCYHKLKSQIYASDESRFSPL